MIEVEHLTKHYQVHEREGGFLASLGSLFHRKYRTVKAVDDISFHIPEGQIVGFLGPNGAGKTTTMKVLTGLLHPTSGQVKVGGYVPFEHKNAFKRRISMVMGQKSQLIWDVPAIESFLVNKAIYEIEHKEYQATLETLVELLDLGAILHKPVRQLSLGERMKCELAAALLHRPDILFLDEPTIGLDVHMQEVMRRFIADYNRSYKATILLTSHYMADVTALCERVMVIAQGQLLYDGGIAQLIERYSRLKRIKLQFAPELPDQELKQQLRQAIQRVDGAEIVDAGEELQVELEVPREQVSTISAMLLSQFPVVDLTIEDPSVESIIGQAYTSQGARE
ncbi:ABC transporter ATP-binding protein [Paenibacillus cremeus]|uniref:ATP-binding cassette domain-containing protein n=1 Tax=Paenibacillus cremeus TaxID=2163881 RepID=A0A559K862_9BACL|nr:ABC transporter ATP-binding protein [Paenibacillus cremeus]TVY08273.1 ATP-binding cassette domain-containing protein [Paenibacillus cremeus]